MNLNYYAVVDIETDGIDPEKCNPLQLGAVIVDPRKLEIVKGSEFSSWIQPPEFHSKDFDYFEEHKDTIAFHCENFKEDKNQFLARLENAQSEKLVWKDFAEYLKSYYIPGQKKTHFSSCILAGYNVLNYDKVILDRMAAKYKNMGKDGKSNLFNKRMCVDVMHLAYYWHEGSNVLPNYKLDTLREHFPFPELEGQAHEALKDCIDTATYLIRYLKLHRHFAQKVEGFH